MNIAVIGGGPAGLYFALLAKKANLADRITVVERNAPDATFGWGVVFSEETLGSLRDADYETYTEISDAFARWNVIDIHYGGQTLRSRGHVFSGISRKVLLNILQRRCCELGVEIAFQREVTHPSELAVYDLVVGADGINGLVRQAHAAAFRPTLTVHRTKYIWLGADLALDAFTFIFRRNQHGLFQVHAYPFDAHTSTFIVECPEEAWRKAGLDAAGEEDSIAYCERLFADELKGRRLLSNRSVWISFVTLRTEAWHYGNVVLVGDAAHTAHFSIGSGTKLAMEDAITLVDALRRHRHLRPALTLYEMERQPVVDRFQEAAKESSTYFENVSRYAGFEPLQFAFNLLTRSRRITHVSLSLRDPEFVRRVDSWFARASVGSRDRELKVAPPPMFIPLSLREMAIPNRVAAAPVSEDDAADGLPGEQHLRRLATVAASGARLLITEMTAISAHARITFGSTGMYSPDHIDAWTRIVREVHTHSAKIALQIGHAGRRGSMRPRREGIDRPLRTGSWPLISASPIPYTPRGQIPREMDRPDFEQVTLDFAAAARSAARCGFDMLELNFGQGYLPGSFLSPLTNQRKDSYGGTLENRLRFPLQIFDAVRQAWPDTKPICVRISASDLVDGGLTVDDAVIVAATLKTHGCDLVHAVMGQTVAEARPIYGPAFGVPASDRIRNEAGIPTLASGHITTADEINTILAAGRADLCVLDIRP